MGGSARRRGAGRLRGTWSGCVRSPPRHPPRGSHPVRERRPAGESSSARLAHLRGLRGYRPPRRSPGEGRGRPQGPSRPTFPYSPGSMALVSVAGADPATASRPPPTPVAQPEKAAAATTWGPGTGRGGLLGWEGARAPPTSRGRGGRGGQGNSSRNLQRFAAGTNVVLSGSLYGSRLARGGHQGKRSSASVSGSQSCYWLPECEGLIEPPHIFINKIKPDKTMCTGSLERSC